MRTRQLDRPTTTRRRGGDRRPGATGAPAPGIDPALADERRARTAGGPEDAALYACACGSQFKAEVTASVACPACGSEQAW